MYIKIVLIVVILFGYVQSLSDFLEWVGGPFDFPCRVMENHYKSQGHYVSKNAIATRIQVFNDDVYVCFPRFKPGIPVTLAKLNQNFSKVLWTPYPDWVSQDEELHSVIDIVVDPYGVLWALDSGVIDSLDNPTRKSPPKVLAFHLQTGRKVANLDLSELVVQISRLQYLQVDYSTDLKPFVYITDAATRSILVLDVVSNNGYRLVLPKEVAAGCRRDVLYAILLRNQCSGDSLLFTYLSGNRVFSIKTDCVRAGTEQGQIQDLGEKDGKIVILGSDGGSVVFYRYEGRAEIYQWDCSNATSFSPSNPLYTSPSCYLATEVVPDFKKERMRVLESNFPDYIQGRVGCGASQIVTLL